ncbi:MAG: hypothetical protein J5960_07205 [Desulfovibrio sp.]|nr:hypothetical protein [Desulfovibrio sp.]
MASEESVSPNDGNGAPAGRGRRRLLLRILLFLVLVGLVAALGFFAWKYKDRFFSARKAGAPDASAVALIPFCDNLSRTVYVLKLDNGLGEILPVLREGGGLAQCGEGAETGYGKVILRQGKAYHVLPQKTAK